MLCHAEVAPGRLRMAYESSASGSLGVPIGDLAAFVSFETRFVHLPASLYFIPILKIW